LEELHIVSEHERIGRDLHDTVIQRLFALGMGLQAAQRLAEPRVNLRIKEAVEAIDEVIREIRETIFDLSRPPASELDVRQRVREVVADVGSHFDFTTRLTFRGPVESAVSEQVLVHLLAVAREALTNVGRHARASNADVVLHATPASVTLSVADDGLGPPDSPSAGHGVANMGDRAAALGGEFHVTARSPRGTLVQWTVPTRLEGSRYEDA
jgi:signal transduction histidine kinase